MRAKHDDSLFVPYPTNWYNPAVTRAAAWLERQIARDSRVGNRPVFDKSIFDWVPGLEAAAPAIRAEAERVLDFNEQLPAFQQIVEEVTDITTDERWKTFIFSGYGFQSKANLLRCPATAQALRQIPGMKTAFFSILAPGKRIPPHRGPYNGVLRLHLGLIVPEPRERCWIRVHDQVCHWKEGEALIIDDSFFHEVHNDTDGYRVVLFVDFERPCHLPAQLYNRAVLAASRWSPRIVKAGRRQLEWERAYAKLEGTAAPTP